MAPCATVGAVAAVMTVFATAANAANPLQINGLVVAGERYVLVAPLDGVVLHAAQPQTIHSPKPALPSDSFHKFIDGSQAAPAIDEVAALEYRKEVYDSIRADWRRAERLDMYLSNSQLQGGSTETSYPDSETSTSDAYGRLVSSVQKLVDNMSENDARRRLKLLVVRLRGRLSGDDLRKIRSEEFSDTEAGLNSATFIRLARKAATQALRERLGLDSDRFFVNAGNKQEVRYRPNDATLLNDKSELHFLLRPASENVDNSGEISIRRFREYWGVLYSESAYDEADMSFLRRLYGDRFDEQSVRSFLLDLDGAVEKLEQIREAEIAADRAIRSLSVGSHQPNAADAELTKALSNRVSTGIGDSIKSAAEKAIPFGNPDLASGITASSPESISWLVGQLLFGYMGTTTDPPALPKLLHSGARVVLVGAPRVRLLVFPGTAKPARYAATYRFADQTLSGIIRSADADDPVRAIFAQYDASLSPTLASMNAKPGSLTADALFTFGQLLQSLESEYRRTVAPVAEELRLTSRRLRLRAIEKYVALRNGSFTVPEPAIVEHVAVYNGQAVRAGDVISIVRPLRRYGFETVADFGVADILIPRSKWRADVSCPVSPGAKQAPGPIRQVTDLFAEVAWNVRTQDGRAYNLRLSLDASARDEPAAAQELLAIGEQCSLRLRPIAR